MKPNGLPLVLHTTDLPTSTNLKIHIVPLRVDRADQ